MLHRFVDPKILPLRIFSIQIKLLACKNIYKGFFAMLVVVAKAGNKANGKKGGSSWKIMVQLAKKGKIIHKNAMMSFY